jgi:hypothetical protein
VVAGFALPLPPNHFARRQQALADLIGGLPARYITAFRSDGRRCRVMAICFGLT